MKRKEKDIHPVTAKKNPQTARHGRKLKKTWTGELIYVFKYVCIDCQLNQEIYGEDEKRILLSILKDLSHEIWIDKTYVDFNGTKFEKTFLTEDGWNTLKDLVRDTKFGTKCTKSQRAMMDDAYRQMISCYMEMVFSDMGWDTENMKFNVADNTSFQVEYRKDQIEEWRSYPGKWQTW